MSKVVLLAPTPPPAGGIAGWTVRFMNAELKNGWEVEVVDEKVDEGRQVFGDKAKRSLLTEIKRCFRIWRDLKRALKDPEALIVHSCIPSMTRSMLREYVCACITKRRKRKFIVHYRCTVPNTTKGRIGRFVLKQLCKKSDMIITLNSQTDEYLEKMTETPLKRIPNFISGAEVIKNRAIRKRIEKVLYVGGVVETKGAFDFVRVAKEFPNMEFRMVGVASSMVKDFAKENDVKNVVFVGPKDRAGVQEEFLDADVFMFLTYFRGEGFSNALAEAMATGLPCIATDWAANKDMIGGEGGFVVPVKDAEAAMRSLREMMPADIRAAQSKANIQKVQREYVDSQVLDQYVECYETCLGLVRKGRNMR